MLNRLRRRRRSGAESQQPLLVTSLITPEPRFDALERLLLGVCVVAVGVGLGWWLWRRVREPSELGDERSPVPTDMRSAIPAGTAAAQETSTSPEPTEDDAERRSVNT